LVVGGAAGLGAWIVKNVWRREPGVSIAVADIQPPEEPEPDVRLHRIRYAGERVAGLPDLGHYDAVVIAVPIPEIPRIAETVLPLVRRGTLVLDIASVKERPMEIIEAALPEGVPYIGTHPLFGPAVPSLIGQTVIVCPSASSAPVDEEWVCDLLARHGAVVRRMSAAEHDRAMAVVQVLTHFTTLTAAAVIAERAPEFRSALDLLTPPFRALAGLVGRVMDIPIAPPDGPGARVYADIQVAPYADAQAIREEFVDAAGRLSGFARAGDANALRLEVESLAERFPPDVLAACRQLFAESSASAQGEAVELYGRRARSELSALESTREGRVIVGRIEAFSSTSITVEVCSARRRLSDGRFAYALGWDDTSRAAAARLGFNVPRQRVEHLPRGEYRLLSESEFDAWKLRALQPHRRDMTLAVPRGMDGERVVGLLPRLVKGVLSSEVVARYEHPGSPMVRWTARLYVRGDHPPERTLADLRSILEDLAIVVPTARVA
jgi:prephenate dehydrogenase